LYNSAIKEKQERVDALLERAKHLSSVKEVNELSSDLDREMSRSADTSTLEANARDAKGVRKRTMLNAINTIRTYEYDVRQALKGFNTAKLVPVEEYFMKKNKWS